MSVDGLSITLLGSGGWIPTSERQTCAALIRKGAAAVLIDAGTGIQRLFEAPELLEGVERVTLLLTHFHLDHVVGLAYVQELPLESPAAIYGPGDLLYGTSTAELLHRLVDPPLLNAPFPSIASDIRELRLEGLDTEVGPIAVRVQTRHSAPTLAFRFGDTLAYCTDTAFDEGTSDFCRGVKFLAHEAWYTEDAPRDTASHTSGKEAGAIAREAGVEELVLIHVFPLGGADAVGLEAQSVFTQARLGTDLDRLC
jgi:ribonuclease BN (tRNA processing enzyme)